ncbi:hypothetical protein CEXT_581521, partial [Caerostris extrusa]
SITSIERLSPDYCVLTGVCCIQVSRLVSARLYSEEMA